MHRPGSQRSAPAPAWAQTPPGQPGTAADTTQVEPQVAPESQSGGVDDIVVTARREAENSQRVPVSIQVVTGTALEKLAITSVEEVTKLAPGLTLVSNGSNTSVTLRGVTWQPGSGTPATPIYLNEVPFDPANVITSLYDVGQIEVLRGPQGTSRGAPSISGAVTISTRKPDLEEFGGYAQALYGSGDHRDAQGAINLPIIKGMLAVRLAANVENSDGNRIYSVNSAIQPLFRDRSLPRHGTVQADRHDLDPGHVPAAPDADPSLYPGCWHRQPRVCGNAGTVAGDPRQLQWAGIDGLTTALRFRTARANSTSISIC